ncbi:MAG: hypothetical protein M1832_005115 [Thelocarpon impressellum]|nr:MAG: hypothetical protein M1832_005115 [Thelocarpon impressellum]
MADKTSDGAGAAGQASADGRFHRQTAQFRSTISPEGSAEFPAEAGRYVLYINYGCPWAHRTNIVLHLKGLEKIIQKVVLYHELTPEGWIFNGLDGTDSKDPLYGFTRIRDLYHKADPAYDKRCTVPVLWDRVRETIVNNESAEIIRMFYSAFDGLVPEERRTASLPGGGYLPPALRAEIEAMNGWVYDDVNNGVYRTGFASTQATYEERVLPLFAALDRLEAHLGEARGPYLFGAHVSEADIRLYPTIVRFDVAYHHFFRCNLRMVRHGYPRLHAWLQRLYWDEGVESNGGAFRKTTNFDHIKRGYANVFKDRIVPMGPDPHILPLEE